MRRITHLIIMFLLTKMSFAATYYVTSTSDANNGGFNGPQGTLRWAIVQANQNPGQDNIFFDINDGTQDANGVYTITMTLNFAQIGEGGGVNIDGYTQPGATIGNPKIRIIGSNNDVFQFVQDDLLGGRDGSGSVVRGFYLGPVQSFCISILGADDILIEDVWIGVDQNGASVTNIGQSKGITITGANGGGASNPDDLCHDITIRNCVFSSNVLMGIDLWQTENVHIHNTYIGTNADGTSSAGGFGNSGAGIWLGNSSNVLIEDNVIAGNDNSSTAVNQASTGGINVYSGENVTIQNNLIGVTTNGATFGNQNFGIIVTGGNGNGHGPSNNVNILNNIISNTTAGRDPGYGILLADADVTNTTIQGNTIEDNANHGIYFANAEANTNIVGGGLGSSDQSLRNVITGNGSDGIHVSGGDLNTLRLNSVFCNSDDKAHDLDGGTGNEGIPEPTFSSANNIMPITGTAPANSTIDFYGMSNCVTCSAGIQGDGQVWLGSTTSDGAGNFSYNGLTATSVSATATNNSGSTSEFSTCVAQDPKCIVPVAQVAEDDTICGTNLSANKITLIANSPLPTEQGAWTVVSGLNMGSVTFDNSNGNITDVDGLTSGPYVFRWTVANVSGLPPAELPCESFDEITIVVDDVPDSASAGPWQTICESTGVTSTTLNASTPVSGTGTWSLLSGSGSIASPNNPTTNVTGLGSGQNFFRWTVESPLGYCPDEINDIMVNIDPGMDITADVSLCSGVDPNFIKLEVLDGNGGNSSHNLGTWALDSKPVGSGAGLQGNPTDGFTFLNWMDVTGDHVVSYTPNSSSCVSYVTVTWSSGSPSATAGSNQNICGTSTTLAGTGSGGSGLWTVTSQPGGSPALSFVDNTDPTTDVSNMTVSGTYTLRYTVTSTCGGDDFDEVDITVDVPPTTALAGNDQDLCADNTTLAGNAPAAGTGQWTVVSGSATFMDDSDPTTTVTSLGFGANVLRWTISSPGICPDETDDVTITTDAPATVAVAGPNQNTCTDTAFMAANTPVVGTGTWSVVSGSATIDDVNDPTTMVSAFPVGMTTLRWTISTTGVCPDETSDITIDRTASAPASVSINPASPAPVCAGANFTFDAIPVNGGSSPTYEWIFNGVNQGVTAADSFVAIAPNANDSIRVIMNSSLGCATGSPASSSIVIITIDSPPSVADAGTDDNICTAAYTLGGNTPAIGTGMWSVVSGSGSFNDPTDPATSVSSLGVGANVFRWTITNGVCPDETSDVTITRVGDLTTPDAGASISGICEDNPGATTDANSPLAGETGTWTVAVGSATFGNINDSVTSVTGLATGINKLVWTMANGSCPTASDTLVILVDTLPTTAVLGNDTTICDDFMTLAANAPVVGTGVWSVESGTGNIVDVNDPTSVVNSLGSGANTLRWSISSGSCPTSVEDIIITSVGAVTPQVSMNASANPVCFGNTIDFSASNVAGGGTNPTYQWTVDGSPVGSGTNYNGHFAIDGQVVKVIMTSDLLCAVPATAEDSQTVSVVLPPSPQISATDTAICENENATLNVTGVQSGSTLEWFLDGVSMGSGNSILIQDAAQEGSWTVQENNGTCPAQSSSAIFISIDRIPTVNAGDPTEMFKDETIFMNGTSSHPNNVLWTPATDLSDPTDLNSAFTPTTGGIYQFTLTATNGQCSDTSYTYINVFEPILVPNAFSPNYDGSNDVWEIPGIEFYPDAKLEVYNRWGSLVYVSLGSIVWWDGYRNGEPMPIATYYYILTPGPDFDPLTGAVTIVR